MVKKLLLTILLLGLSSCESNENFNILKDKSETRYSSYAILGDSITDAGNVSEGVTGGASSPSKGYATLLYNKLRTEYGTSIKFDNHGVGGETVKQASARVNKEFLSNDYDLIIVELGTNDWNYGTPIAEFRKDYEVLISRLKKQTKAEIVTISLGYFGNWKGLNTIASEVEYNKIIFQMSKKYGTKSIDVRNPMIEIMQSGKTFEDITFKPDPVHPNDLGHRLWAETIYNKLIEN